MAPAQRVKPQLTLFDLDHTLLSGDSDVLWCDFLMDKGLLDRSVVAAQGDSFELVSAYEGLEIALGEQS